MKAGCICDLRVKPCLYPDIRAQWRNVYFDLVNKFSQIAELHECAFMYAAVLTENQRMLKTFRDPNTPIIHEKIDEFGPTTCLPGLPSASKVANKAAAM